ncbi:hypothetical protein [Actinokineospora inagensis]|uniref:hypothetical protein n=1 Tax=Actinokineospora inagensis TaxID=103730 RepID=UPI000411E1EC|nr:hypothetical protein [Actinokineospora inagensis]
MNARGLGPRIAAAASVSAVLVAGSAQVAVADSGAVESSVPFSVAGPVGIAAVVVGVGGFAVGLVRRRKVAKAEARIALAAEQAAAKVAQVVGPLKVPAPRRSQAEV